MRLNAPRLGEILAGVSGLLLGFSLVLPWYRSTTVAACPAPPADCAAGTRSYTGFEAFAALDVYLLVIAAAGVGLLVAELVQRTPAIAVAWAAISATLGLVATVLVVWRTVDPPVGGDAEPLFALLGLLAAAGVGIGCLLSMRDEGFGIRPKPGLAATLRGAATTGGPEPLPAPPPGGGERAAQSRDAR